MSTIHNPVNFEPNDYQVVEYIDNRPPEMPRVFTQAAFEMYDRIRKDWRERIERLNVQGGIHKCCHCGNGTIRYVAVCLHKPTGRNVAFGDICVDRLNLPGKDAFKAKFIRTAAANEAARIAREEKIAKTLNDNPGLEQIFQGSKNPFIMDVSAKLTQYGELSARQIEAVFQAAKRDAERLARMEAEKAAAGPVPIGKRITFAGVIVSTRVEDGPYGRVVKCLIKLDNGSKIWGTCPSGVPAEADKKFRVTIRATVEAKQGEPTFGFMNRPHLVSVEQA